LPQPGLCRLENPIGALSLVRIPKLFVKLVEGGACGVRLHRPFIETET
jgi:hypothetical protein